MSLIVIDKLLQEFYQSTTPNNRKREIENELLSFKTQPDAWQICLREAVGTQCNQNQFLWFFSCATLSHAITRRWSQLNVADRTLIRETLWNAYINLPLSGGLKMKRDTLGQLMALMGKREFPDEHNFMLQCMELIRNRFALGVNLLRLTSEEVVSNKEDVTTERKQYFQSCVSVCIPEVMDLMTKYLLIAVCHVNGKDIQSMPNSLIDYSLALTLPNDNHFSSSLLELLNCLQHLVSWTSTDLISEYLLMGLLDLAQYRSELPEHSLAALSVINEILYLQKPLPCAMTLITGINKLLLYHDITKSQNEMYIDKFRELLRLYAIKYWPKMLNEPGGLLEDFLRSLFLCTICRNGALDFTEKLEIWSPIIKGLMINDKLNICNDIILQLVSEIMQRIQFEYNKAELELLDNELIDDNTQTEWQQFLMQCIECIALIAEARPIPVFNQVSHHWRRLHTYLEDCENEIDCGKSLELARKLKSTNFCEHLKDFSTICHTLTRIAPLLENQSQYGCDVNIQLNMLAESLVGIMKFFTRNNLIQLNVDKTSFQVDYDYLFAQILMAIRSILPLSTLLRNEQSIQLLLVELGSIFLPNTTFSQIVYMAASQLLLCISSVIRPKFLLETPAIMSLMQKGPALMHLPSQVIANIYISLISYLILPWKNVDNNEQQQDFTRRCAVLREYVTCLSRDLLELDIEKDPKISNNVLTTLNNFSEVIKFFKDSSNTSKEMLTLAFKPVLTKALMIYNSCGLSNNQVANAVADFSLSIINTLMTQLGTQFIKEMITLFITVSSREKLNVVNLTALEKNLQMFQVIVEQPGSSSLTMLPAILDFTLQQILPLIQGDTNLAYSGEIMTILYSLFHSILICKWQYFYKSNIQQNGSLTTVGSGGGENLHASHFTAILNAYGQALVSGSDPNIVRQVLQSMQNINERWRLYQRSLFKDNLLASFQTALINMLLSGDGALHFELLTNELYAMGQVDTLKLRERFMTSGIPVNLKVIDEICLSSDIPTFSQKLTQLMQDAHFVHMTQVST